MHNAGDEMRAASRTIHMRGSKDYMLSKQSKMTLLSVLQQLAECLVV